MSVLSERMTLIADLLADAMPSRKVTRSFKDFEQRQPEELKAGVLTLISRGESDYANLRDRPAMDGRHQMTLIGQLQVNESSEKLEIEEAEFDLVEELKAFMRNLPPTLACLELKNFRQSGQIEHPYGWIACELEITS